MAIDAQWDNVSLLLPLSADLLDAKGSVITPGGGAALSSSVGNPFGAGNACRLDGTGDYLVVDSSAVFDFGTSGGTIEAWVYISANASADGSGNRRAVIMSTQYGSDTTYWAFTIDGNGSTTGTGLFLDTNLSGTSQVKSASVSISQSAWHHIMVAWNGSNTFFGIDGAVTTTTAFSQAVNKGSGPRVGGQNVSGYLRELNGYIAQVRVTNGYARYAGTYTPPSVPFLRPTIKGVVLDASAAPVAKRVIALKRSTQDVSGIALSDAGTGIYTIYPVDYSEHQVYRVDASTYPLVDGGSGENALIYDRVIPGG